MPILRTVAAVWIASMVGIVSTFAFLNMTGPFAPMVLDGVIGSAVFALGSTAGFLAAQRLGRLVVRRRLQSAV